MNVRSWALLTKNEIEVLLAIAPVLRNRWIQPPPTSAEQLANMKLDDDVKLMRRLGYWPIITRTAYSMLENLMDFFGLLLG